MRLNRVAALLFSTLLVANAASAGPLSPLVGDSLSARVKGWQAGNWGVAIGDQVGTAGGFVSASGDQPWIGTNVYSFVLNYSAATGLATFQVTGTGYDSGLLTTPNYGITGYGFAGIELGLVAANNATYQTSLVLSNLLLNAGALGPYTATTTYTNYVLYSGSPVMNISLTGQFVFTGDVTGLNEGTKFDIYLKGAQMPVPEPASLLLLGTGLAAMAARRRFTKRT